MADQARPFDKQAHQERIEQELTRQNAVVTRLCHAIRKHRSPAMECLMESNRCEQREAVQEAGGARVAGRAPGARYGLIEPAGAMAIAIWERLTPEEREGVRLYRGHVIYERHSWFVIEIDSAALECPRGLFVVDPAPRGVGFWATSCAEIMVLHPGSPLQSGYYGEEVTGSDDDEEMEAEGDVCEGVRP